MRYTLLAASLALGLSACQISRTTYPTGIFTSAAAFRQRQPSLVGDKAGRVVFRRKLFVEGPTTPRTTVAMADAWGYADTRGTAFRVFKGHPFQVEQADSLVLYSNQEYKSDPAYVATATPNKLTTAYYFSRGLTGPVQPLTRRRLRRTFADSPTFLGLLDQRPHRSLLANQSPATAPPSYRVVALYRQSLAQPGQ